MLIQGYSFISAFPLSLKERVVQIKNYKILFLCTVYTHSAEYQYSQNSPSNSGSSQMRLSHSDHEAVLHVL